jgi:stage IV sporulation protein A
MEEMHKIKDMESAVNKIGECELVSQAKITKMQLGNGNCTAKLDLPRKLFYETMTDQTGFPIQNDGELLVLLTEMAKLKKEYEKVGAALEEVRAKGYGIVVPSAEELVLEEPEIVKQGGRYGVLLKASAPSIQHERNKKKFKNDKRDGHKVTKRVYIFIQYQFIARNYIIRKKME